MKLSRVVHILSGECFGAISRLKAFTFNFSVRPILQPYITMEIENLSLTNELCFTD